MITFICVVLLTLAILLLRQVRMTRKAREGLGEWKRLYEQAHGDRDALLRKCRELERHIKALSSQVGASVRGVVAGSPGLREPKTNRPAGLIASGTKEAVKKLRPLTLILPIQLLSKNGRDKLHYRARGELRNQYKAILDIKYRRREPAPSFRQKLTVIRVKGPRERDFDQQNIGAGSAIEPIGCSGCEG